MFPFLGVSDWRELNGRPLPEIVAAQWERTTRILLDDLDALPAERRHVVCFDIGSSRRIVPAVLRAEVITPMHPRVPQSLPHARRAGRSP